MTARHRRRARDRVARRFIRRGDRQFVNSSVVERLNLGFRRLARADRAIAESEGRQRDARALNLNEGARTRCGLAVTREGFGARAK